MTQKFIKKIEDFSCEQCRVEVRGTGFTNHCPQCLWSKHVDVFPGDRAEDCAGLMQPINLVVKKKQYAIVSQCLKCGEERTNKIAEGDNIGVLLNAI